MKRLIYILILICSVSWISPSLDPRTAVEQAQNSDNRRAQAHWNYQFSEEDRLYDNNRNDVDMMDIEDVHTRYNRMFHFPFLSDQQAEESLDRVMAFSQHLPMIIPFLQEELSNLELGDAKIESLSMYGSFLYSIAIPDDIDMFVIVDSPVPVYHHIDIWISEISGEKEDDEVFPILSFQIIDRGTLDRVRNSLVEAEKQGVYHSGDKLLSQRLAMGSNWFFTLYGRPLRYDSPEDFSSYRQENHLKKAFDSLKSAGSRLFGQAYTRLSPEPDRVRLRKVVSRIMITDFLLAKENLPTSYSELYQRIREVDDDDAKEWELIQEELEKIYYSRMAILLIRAKQHGRMDQVVLLP